MKITQHIARLLRIIAYKLDPQHVVVFNNPPIASDIIVFVNNKQMKRSEYKVDSK